MTLTNNRVTLKLFFGCLLTPDIEMRRINSDGDIQALTETYFQEKKYLGFFLDQPSASLSDFRLAEKEIRDSLAYYCSDLPIENLKLFIFSQIFIT
jgi:hypothetical protein